MTFTFTMSGSGTKTLELSLEIEGSEYISSFTIISSKVALSGLRQFLAIESCLRLMKNAFYFNLNAHFVLKIFKFLS